MSEWACLVSSGLRAWAGPKGGRLRRSTFRRTWTKARSAVSLPDLHFHDLRHTGNTMAAGQGASLRELMERDAERRQLCVSALCRAGARAGPGSRTAGKSTCHGCAKRNYGQWRVGVKGAARTLLAYSSRLGCGHRK